MTSRKYNFDEIIERRNTNSVKWHVKDDELPLWVADMDFRVAPEILKAIEQRVDNGIFGYTYIEDKWKDSVINWWKKRHFHTINPDSLVFTLGGVPAFATILREFTDVGDKVLLSSPAYNAFYNVVRNNGRIVVENDLQFKNDKYSLDIKDLENKMSDERAKLFILCNPHNPTGNIWTKEELVQIGNIAKKHAVLVISDEIHCDIVDPGLQYTPYASVSDVARMNSITLSSCTKAFNVAGIQTSIAYADNSEILTRLKKAVNDDEVGEANVFSVLTTVAAFDKSEDWLIELNEYLYKNKIFVREFAKEHLSKLKVINQGATYLMWIGIEDYLGKYKNSKEFCYELRKKTGLYVSDGMIYGKESGKNFFRLNVACPRSRLEDAMKRLEKFIKS